MKFKYAIAGLVLLTLVGGPLVFAQVTAGERPPGQARAGQKAKKQGIPASGAVEAFSRQLGLSEEQTNKVQYVVLNYRRGVKGIMQNTSLKPEERQAKVQELRTKSDLEIRAILTAAQSERAQKENMIQKLLVVGPAAPNLQQLTDELKLTDDQKQKVAAIFREQQTRKKEIAQNPNLSDEARKEQAKALRLETHQKIEAVLTDEQRAKYRELVKASRGQSKVGDQTESKVGSRAEHKAAGHRGHGKKTQGGTSTAP